MKILSVLVLTILSAIATANGQASLPIYTDSLVNGFQDWSWAPRNLSNSAPVYSGSYSISVNATHFEAIAVHHTDFNTSLYSNLTFWLNGGPKGGQVLQIVGLLGANSLSAYLLPALTANTWQQFVVPLSALGVANQTNCDGFWFELSGDGTTNTFYLDAIELTSMPAPALVHLSVNAAQVIRTADARWFGINTAVWDSDLDTAETASQLNEAGLKTLRFPGGSESDDYHWQSNTTDSNTWTWGASFSSFAHLATNIGAQTVITVNYGTGTPAEAAAWVRSSNVTNKYGFKYWEIGNELYGTWETDSNTYPNDPYTYAVRAESYIQQMKAVDPTIKIGVVVATGEDADSNGYTSHPATNMVTQQVHYGWTPVLLSTLKSLGVTPDFAIYHWYPEYTDGESDSLLLQGTSNWLGDAADLRQQITGYFGPGGTNIELLCTENNSNSGEQGKQSVSLVNGLYYADSLCQLMQTEFNSFIWWDLRNGQDFDGNIDPTLYGWRLYGDIGTLNGLATDLTNRYPEFFTAKLMQCFVRAGDTILKASSDYALLSAYAAQRTNGSMTMMVINKDSVSNLTAQIALEGFTPSSTATIYSYGMPQDNAAEAGDNACDIAQSTFTSATTNFTYTFAPYSVTVFSYPPAAPTLTATTTTIAGQPSSLVLQLSGQNKVPYILQTSSNLITWASISTNIATSTTLNLTNTPAPGEIAQFWRAIWIP